MWNLSRGRSIVGSSGVDIGDGSDPDSLAANNYATSLMDLQRFGEARSLMRRTIPVARRVLGESNDLTLRMRWLYSAALYEDSDATLDALREAVTTLESVAPSWKLVFGDSHPETPRVQGALADARNRLARAVAASESQSPP